ncbi:MAG TPA: choline kinase family protein [Gaiellaceae bacterium]|nr:choline kinase family protein [Gaiellaceae bacterium]
MRAEQIAARVWPDQELEIEPLGGGITNHNFVVRVDGKAYVLRIAGEDTELLGIDRAAEHEAARIAAGLGVGPEVVDFVEGSLITRFVDGGIIPIEVIRRPEGLREVAGLLRRIHEGPPFPATFDAFRVVEAYRGTAEAHGVRIPPQYAEAKTRADEIERTLGTRPAQPCHNDLLNANFIRSPAGIRIVDWEYAGMGDRFFDLANFSVNHELSEAESDSLLHAYFGQVTDEAREHLRLMRFMSDFREAMWGVVQQGISKLDFDYEDYASRHFERALS